MSALWNMEPTIDGVSPKVLPTHKPLRPPLMKQGQRDVGIRSTARCRRRPRKVAGNEPSRDARHKTAVVEAGVRGAQEHCLPLRDGAFSAYRRELPSASRASPSASARSSPTTTSRSSSTRARCWRSPGRERRRQVDAGVDPLRALRARRGVDRGVRRRSCRRGDPAAALAAGIGMVHQHFTLAGQPLRARQRDARHRPVGGPARAGASAAPRLDDRAALRPAGRSFRARATCRSASASASRSEGALSRRRGC